MSTGTQTPSPKAALIGAVNPRMDVKVGDLMEVRAIEGQRRDGRVEEVLVTHTIEVQSVDVIGKHLWCKGPIIKTDGLAKVGTGFPVYLGAV